MKNAEASTRGASESIPRIIHYCWFGHGEKPKLIKQCIDSWNKHLPGYTILEWNESKIDLNRNAYAREAYAARKFAFVSDYVRMYALYHHGGIYLDTDVEVFRTFDPFLRHDTFWGFEQEHYIATSTIGARPGHPMIRSFLDMYEDIHFIREDGGHNELTNVARITRWFQTLGLKRNGEYQELYGANAFYPQTYFAPYDYINCRSFATERTVAVHYFHKSWLPPKARWKGRIKKLVAKTIGGHNLAKVRGILR